MNMYNGKAYVNTSDRKVPVYELTANELDITNKQIGLIYPNECFGIHPSEGNVSFVAFRNSSGVPAIGGFVSVEPEYTLYGERKSNGSALEKNTRDSSGYFVHTLSKNMNWYIGDQKQPVSLKAGTQVKIKDCTTGSDKYFRMACKMAKLSGEREFKELNPGGVFWIDFLTIGSMPYNRSIL